MDVAEINPREDELFGVDEDTFVLSCGVDCNKVFIVVGQPTLCLDHRHFRSRLHAIVLKHVWDQLFTVNTIWSIGETGDIYISLFHFTSPTNKPS